MNDNILNVVDARRSLGEAPLTVEGALLAGVPPLERMADVDNVRHHLRCLRLAREYLVDFDLVRACARAGLEWDLCKAAERDPLFITMCRTLMEDMKPEEVITRAEILQMLKREATTAGKSADRINAMNHLARLAGMELKEEKQGGGAPVINITLQGGPVDKPPMVNVTTSTSAPRSALLGGELL